MLLKITQFCVLGQGTGLAQEKVRAMIGMFHDGGQNTKMLRNVAAGSERAGFSGPGIECGNVELFRGNEVHSALAGFWFDFYAVQQNPKPCLSLSNFTAWKIFEYAVYGELMTGDQIQISDLSISDAIIGVNIKLFGGDSLSHVLLNKTVSVTNSLIVGSSGNGKCPKMPELLYTCAFYMAHCQHLSAGTYLNFPKDSNESQVIILIPWLAFEIPNLFGCIVADGWMENGGNSAEPVFFLSDCGCAYMPHLPFIIFS